MKMVNCFLKKTFFLVLVTALLASSCSIGVFAATGNYNGPSIVDVDLDLTRSVITLTFNQEIEAAVSSFNGKIKLSKDGKALQSIPTSSKVNISGYRMTITLSTALDTANNYVYIAEGTLERQDIPVESSLFDARGPVLSSTRPVYLTDSGRTVTLKFTTGIKGYPNNDVLKNGYISLARNGSSYNEIIPANDIDVDIDKGEIVIELDEPLSGNKSRFKIAAGTLQNTSNGNINLKDITTAAIKVSDSSVSDGYTDEDDSVQIKSTSISSDLRTVTVYFTERIKNAFATTGTSSSLAQTFIKSHIFLSRENLNNFEPLGGGETVTVGSNYVKIVFTDPLIDKSNYIKFDKESLTDNQGYALTHDLITNSITDSTTANTSVPQYSSVTTSGTNKIKITFTTPVVKVNSLSAKQLLSSISISRNGGSFVSLTTNDSVSISSNTLTITLEKPISGSRNRVRIAANTLTSKVGVPLDKSVTTDYFSVSSSSTSDDYDDYDDYYAPQYDNVVYDESTSRIRVYFENDIKVTSSTNLVSSITISRNGGTFKPLEYNDVVTVSPSNAVSIRLDEPLSGTKNRVRIAKGALADYETGYVLNETVTTDYFDAGTSTDDDASSESTKYSGDASANLSDDFYSITLQFDKPFYNNYETLDQLKEKIQISRNGKFSALTSDDYVRVDEANNELLIILAKPAEEYFSRVRILSGALIDENEKVLSNAITTLPLGEADGDVRTYVNNKAFFISVSTEENSSSIVATLDNESDIASLSKSSELLIKLPQTRNTATLNVSSAVVSKLKSLSATIALSLGNHTYYIPANNIPTLASGDMFSIKIANTNSASQSLALSSSNNSFSTKASAANLTASVVSASGSSTAIKHTSFAKKRIMVEEVNSNTFFTVVRIEDSGAVVPVPTNTDSSSGVTYLTARTLEDGNYSAISAVHTFSNTPSWVTLPSNTLGSKLILANETGSDLKANQAISRAETVTIMSKTLGVFGDANGASPFFDMLPSDSYFNAVMSAVSYSLISGYPDGTFKPSGNLTRAEAMTIVARAMRFLNGKSVSASSEISIADATTILSKFADAGTVDNWAKADIAECVKAGVVNGDNNGRLNPKSQVTRAELIQLMYNLLDKADLL